ncbi:hypothetical protein RMR16_000045 [Agrobacterium sp. rho-13.3]|nr:hypothetical protein [Agrobacterium sp. rho-13.3]
MIRRLTYPKSSVTANPIRGPATAHLRGQKALARRRRGAAGRIKSSMTV